MAARQAVQRVRRCQHDLPASPRGRGQGQRSERAGRRDLLAAAAWAQRAQTAYGAYLAHVRHVRVPSARPSLLPSPSSPAGQGSSVVAPDWAGYGATGGGFRSVTATWTEPDVSIPQDGKTTEVSTWVGLDGQGDAPLEQVGTEAFCAEGVPFVFHKAFFEMLPKPPVYLALEVNSGDEMTATVTALADHRFRLTLTDDSSPARGSPLSRPTGRAAASRPRSSSNRPRSAARVGRVRAGALHRLRLQRPPPQRLRLDEVLHGRSHRRAALCPPRRRRELHGVAAMMTGGRMLGARQRVQVLGTRASCPCRVRLAKGAALTASRLAHRSAASGATLHAWESLVPLAEERGRWT